MSSGNWIVTRMTSIVPPNFGSGAEVHATQDAARARCRECYRGPFQKWTGRLDSNRLLPAPKPSKSQFSVTLRLLRNGMLKML
jgi:hypothetical protein